jgi:hypothetical protein
MNIQFTNRFQRTHYAGIQLYLKKCCHNGWNMKPKNVMLLAAEVTKCDTKGQLLRHAVKGLEKLEYWINT